MVIRLKVPIEMHYTVIPMGTSKVNSSPELDADIEVFTPTPVRCLHLRPFSCVLHFRHFCALLTSGWWRGTVVERRSLAGELSLSCARPAADG